MIIVKLVVKLNTKGGLSNIGKTKDRKTIKATFLHKSTSLSIKTVFHTDCPVLKVILAVTFLLIIPTVVFVILFFTFTAYTYVGSSGFISMAAHSWLLF